MLIIAFDSSSSMSIALIKDQIILQEKNFKSQNKHSELLISEIKKILISNNFDFDDIDLVVATNGPGSFTGIRVGLSVLKMLNITLKIPCITVNSCEVIAQKYISQHENIKVVIQGNADEIYFAHYKRKNNLLNEVLSPAITNFDTVVKNLKYDDFLCGSANLLFVDHDLKSNLLDPILARDFWQFGEYYQNKRKNHENFLQHEQHEILPLYLHAPKISCKK